MASFNLPVIFDTPDLWGPPSSSNNKDAASSSVLPAEFRDIPFVPFAKGDKIGRIADWNASGSGGDGGSVTGLAISSGGGRGGASRRGGGGRDGTSQSYGAGAGSNAFAYFHGDDEATFSVVDNARTTASKRGGLASMSRGRGGGGASTRGARGGTAATRGGIAARGAPAGRGTARGGAVGRGGARKAGWKDWNKPQRIRDASVDVGADWQQVEEIEFTRLSKLRLEVGEPEELSAYGTVAEYDRTYDRISSVRFEKPLQSLDRVRYNPTSHDDPILCALAEQPVAAPAEGEPLTTRIFATDSILALLMTATRSVYPWDVIVTRHESGNIFLDKRDGGAFDFVSVNENAAEPPLEASEAAAATDGAKELAGKDRSGNAASSINTPGSLSLEATYIQQNFGFQVVNEKKAKQLKDGANPFYDAATETEKLASCGLRYRKFDVSAAADEKVELYVRTEVDALLPAATKGAAPQYVTVKTLIEFDARAAGAGGAPDWRTKLDSQRGAVVATEMKNNSAKLARFAVQSILAGAENMKMGYISRANPRDASRHVILGTQWYKPREFAAQINVNLANGWGIVRTIADLARKAPGDGTAKFVLMKDPNKQVLRFYSVPASWPADEDDYE